MTPITMLILVVTGVATWAAFRRPDLRERWIFNPYAILRHGEYPRMVTSALIHANWMHFAGNAYSLYCFGQALEILYGARCLLVIYLASIVGGSALSLFLHRHHDYRALGASGGVCGLIFASIFLLPGGGIGLFLIPFGIPAYLYAIVFLVVSFIAHRRQKDHVGHDAHLGGAIVGLLTAACLYPEMIFAAPAMFATVLMLSGLILLVLIFDPWHRLERRLQPDSPADFGPGGDERTRDYAANRTRRLKKEEIDRLLDKVAEGGIQKLSTAERKRLDELSKEVYGRAS